jgi:hypothetical protein
LKKVHAECAENAENIGFILSELSGLSLKMTHYRNPPGYESKFELFSVQSKESFMYGK